MVAPFEFAPGPKSVASATEPSIRIGNFYFHAPNGIAFIQNDAAAFVINPAGPYNAGTVSPDDSFHKIIFSPETVTPHPQGFVRPAESGLASLRRVEFQWSRKGDVIVGRLVSAYPGEMAFSLRENWPGFTSQFFAEPGGVRGVATLTDGKTVDWSLKAEPAAKLKDPAHFTVPLGGPKSPTYLMAGFGELPSFDEIDHWLFQAERSYESQRPRAQGPSGDILKAITDNLNNSRIYSSDNKMVAISVSRTFGGRTPNSCPYFCWDSFFSGLLATLDNPEMGRQTVRAILSYQSPDGLVPNAAHSEMGTTKDRSQPPVGSMCVWKMHLYRPDIDFLREVYPKLALWNSWWMKARNAKKDGLLQWGSSTGVLRDAQWETGWDDTPHFEGVKGIKMVGSTMNAYAVDLCSLWAMDAHYLALIADHIGRPEDARRHRQDEADMIRRINERLWNEELGIYCSRFWDREDGAPGDFLTRLTPANFYPLICGVPDRNRAKRVLALMTDPAQFWGEWILPTVSRQDPVFLAQSYWHGTIWAPVNYLVFQGVKRYAPAELQAAFAQKSVHLFMDNWLANGYCGENFLSINGSVGGDQYYTWGALMCLIGLESVVDIGDDGIPQTGSGYNEPVELTNLPIGGKRHRVTLRLGKPEVTVTG
jgi:glycogen debranching enzyme